MMGDIVQAAETVENVTGVSAVTIKDLFYIVGAVVAGVSAYLLGRFKVQLMDNKITVVDDKVTSVRNSLIDTKEEIRKEKSLIHERIGKTKDGMTAQLNKINDKLDESLGKISTDLAEIKGYLKAKEDD